MSRIARICDFVVHTASEQDLHFHRAALTRIFSESRNQGLEVWVDPWGVGNVFGGEAFSKFLLDHRDAWQILSDGRVVPAACVNHPEFIAYIKEWTLNMRESGAQVILWDEPHPYASVSLEMEGVYSCTCQVCQKRFRKYYGAVPPAKLNEDARDFRIRTFKSFLSEMMGFARHCGLKNALTVYALNKFGDYHKVWEEIPSIPDLDIFGCDPYWRWHRNRDPAEFVGEFARKTVEVAKRNGKSSMVWIQAMKMPKGSEHEIKIATQTAVDSGITHIAAWSYDGGELLDPVLSVNPARVWGGVRSAFSSIRNQK